MKIIGLHGEQGVGKDTIADVLVREAGYVKVAFADPLRRAAVELTGLGMEYFTHRVLKNKPLPGFGNKTPRDILKLLGTEFARDVLGDDIFIRHVYHSITKAGIDNKNLVVTDVRFPNELKYIKSYGGMVYGVERPGYKEESSGDGHRSNQKLEGLDGTILNSGDIDDLEHAVRHILIKGGE